MRKLKKGFTIVELVIVIAVIAVLTAVLVPTFISLSKKARTANDQTLVSNLNKVLKIKESEKGRAPYTVHEAIEGIYEYGYVVENLAASSDSDLVYSLKENKFFLSKDVEQSYNYWHLYSSPDQVPSTQTWSIYASGGDWTEFNEINVGFDAGDVETKALAYVSKTNTKKDIVIRTNSATTDLSINGYVNPSNLKEGDVIYHYGYAGALNVVKCATGSYHENGKVSFAEISTGRIVLESSSEVEHIHINANNTNTGFGEVVIADAGTKSLPDSITRDEVTVTETTKVVTVVTTSGVQEIVNVYAEGSKGTTEKTDTQNVDVHSSLGGLVLDNGTESKALDEDAKYEAKDAVASEVVSDEFVSDPENDKYVARIGQTGYLKLKAAIDAAVAGKTVVLLKDVSFEGITGSNRLFITKDITLDGNNHTVTAHGRGFGIGTEKVTFKNVTIDNPDGGARCIDTRGGTNGYPAVKELNLLNVTLSTQGNSGYLQPLTIGGNQSYKMKINIEDSILMTNIHGNAGYTIISFNPVDMTIKNSKVFGWACIYLKGVDGSYGSKGSIVKIYNSLLSSTNIYRGTSDNFGTIVLEDEDINIDISNSELRANALYVNQDLISFSSDYYNPDNCCINSTVRISGESTVTFGSLADNGNYGGEGCELIISGGKYDSDPSQYLAPGKTATKNSDGVWVVR